MASRKIYLARNLEDVGAQYPDDGDSLVWVAASGLWQPVAVSGGGAAGGDFIDLDDVPSSYATFSGYYVQVKDTEDGLKFSEISGGGASVFTDLSDVPGSYSGEGGKLVVVKIAEDGLEFVASGAGGGASTFLDLSDTPSSFSGQAGKSAVVNDGEDALEFVTISGGAGGTSITATQKSIFTSEASAQDAHTADGAWEDIVAMSGFVTLDEPGILEATFQSEVKRDSGNWAYFYFRYQVDHAEMGTFYSPTYRHERGGAEATTLITIEDVLYVWSGVAAGDFTVRTQWKTTSQLDVSFFERQFTVAGEWEVTGIPSLDHGSLDGLEDDDHPQYLVVDSSKEAASGFTVGSGIGTVDAYIDGAAGQYRNLTFQTAGVDRWRIRTQNTAEVGADSGSDFEITGRADNGAWLNTPLRIYRASGDIKAYFDFYTAPWEDYADSSSIVGWTTYTSKKILYKKVGKLVFVDIHISGVSNDTVVTFTLPYTSESSLAYQSPLAYVQDAGSVVSDGGRIRLPGGSATVTCYRTMASSAWTGSGDKTVIGQFWYEAV